MEEHKFPFDVNADLRREVKLDVEREVVEREVDEIKKRILRIIGWFFFAVGLNSVVVVAGGFSHSDWTLAINLVLFPLLALFVKYRRSRGIYWLWRDLVNARKQLRSWNELADHYNRVIRSDEQTSDN